MSMDEKSYRIIGKSDIMTRYEFPENVPDFNAENPMVTLSRKLMAETADRTDKTMVEAILHMCWLEGITDLWLIDKKFILEAITEKLEREKKHGV